MCATASACMLRIVSMDKILYLINFTSTQNYIAQPLTWCSGKGITITKHNAHFYQDHLAQPLTWCSGVGIIPKPSGTAAHLVFWCMQYTKTSRLRRLESTFGISGVALSWFESFLSVRTQSVVVDGLMSTPIPLVFGVPQGSVFGPVLFTLYSQHLSDVIACHSCDYHKYADDRNLWRCTTLRFHFCSVQHLILYKRYFVMDAKQQTKAEHRKNWDDACRLISAYQFSWLWVCRYSWKLHSFWDHCYVPWSASWPDTVNETTHQ